MEKKQYVTPAIELLAYNSNETLLTAVSSNWGIGSGVVDETGTMDPASRIDY